LNATNIHNLETAAKGLGELLDQVVFVGGATVEFYAPDAGAPQSRPTVDVDCIIDVHSYDSYGHLEEALRKKGFRNDQRKGAPLCRWIYEDMTIDVMPTETEVLGFSSRWYEEGTRHTSAVNLPQGQRIRILQPSYFLASKLEAAKSRGWVDLRASTDFEDVVYVLRNRNSIFNDILHADLDVQQYITDTFAQVLARDDADEAIAAVLDFGEPVGTAQMIRNLIKDISKVGHSHKR
jgi:predicted nucleotidyltransferase